MVAFQFNRVASIVVRNRHLIEFIEQHKARAPRARIFVFAGAGHFPPAGMYVRGSAEAECHEIQVREIQSFLDGHKYVVLAHKALFTDPRGKFDKTEL